MAQSTKIVILVGVALVVTGVVAGLLPIESSPLAMSDCGSVFDPANRYLEGPECGAARSGRALFAWGPIVLGAVLTFGAVLMDPSFGKPKPAAGQSTE